MGAEVVCALPAAHCQAHDGEACFSCQCHHLDPSKLHQSPNQIIISICTESGNSHIGQTVSSERNKHCAHSVSCCAAWRVLPPPVEAVLSFLAVCWTPATTTATVSAFRECEWDRPLEAPTSLTCCCHVYWMAITNADGRSTYTHNVAKYYNMKLWTLKLKKSCCDIMWYNVTFSKTKRSIVIKLQLKTLTLIPLTNPVQFKSITIIIPHRPKDSKTVCIISILSIVPVLRKVHV